MVVVGGTVRVKTAGGAGSMWRAPPSADSHHQAAVAVSLYFEEGSEGKGEAPSWPLTSGLRSLCTTMLRWQYSTPEMICWKNCRASSSISRPFSTM